MRWTELHSSLQLIGEMFHHGGVVTTISGGGSEPLARLILQPDADMLFKINVAHPTDASLPERLQVAVQGLMARLSDAQHRVSSVHRVAQLGMTLLLGGLAAFGVTRIESILWQIALAATMSLAALLSRWLIRLALRSAVTWAMH